MIIDLEQASGIEFQNPAVCIVGAGAAGIVLALELLRHGKRVVLLEGGGRFIEPDAQESYRSALSGLPHKGIHEGRFRALGGTTTRWGGQILELCEPDFESRPWIKGSGWPFPKSVLAPYYKRALNLEGLANAAVQDAEVWRALEIDPLEELGDQVSAYLSRWCPEPNFGRLHRHTLEKDERLAIYLHANAVGIELDTDGNVLGVKCSAPSGKSVTFRSTTYVLCLGGIETCRFLLQPRGCGRYPWSTSPVLGRYFNDHLDVSCGELSATCRSAFHRRFDNIFLRGYKYQPKLRATRQFQVQHQTLNVGATFAFVSRVDEELTNVKRTVRNLKLGRWNELAFKDVGAMLVNLPTLGRQIYRYTFEHRAFVPTDSQILFRVHCEQEPLSKSNITLTNQRDSLGLFRARLDWRISDSEIKTIRRFAEGVQSAFAKRGWTIREAEPTSDLTDANLTNRVSDSNHHMGGARMAESPAEGVVSPQLQIHGSRNAYVCSAAVFPSSGFSNPTHTVLALAVRLADHLATRG